MPKVPQAPPDKQYLGNSLKGIPRCPHCGIAHPHLALLFRSDSGDRPGYLRDIVWALYQCSSCNSCLSVKGGNRDLFGPVLIETFPRIKTADPALPANAKHYLQQAYETLHAPNASTIMAASAIDAMLKNSGYKDGTLFARINKAVEQGVLTKNMGEWAHATRLESNRPRHADVDDPHITKEEAEQAVEFAQALGYFLYVLPAQIKRGTKKQAPATVSPQAK